MIGYIFGYYCLFQGTWKMCVFIADVLSFPTMNSCGIVLIFKYLCPFGAIVLIALSTQGVAQGWKLLAPLDKSLPLGLTQASLVLLSLSRDFQAVLVALSFAHPLRHL